MLSKKFLVFIFVAVTLSSFFAYQGVHAASYGRTIVYFSIPTDTSFSVKVLGATVYNVTSTSSGSRNLTSPAISFNATSLTQNDVQAQSTANSANTQTGIGKPIYVLANTGTVSINVSMYWSSSENGGPDSCVTVRMNSSCNTGGGCSGAGGFSNERQVSTTSKSIVSNLSVGNKINVTLIANFSSCSLSSFDTIADLNSDSAAV